MKNLPKTTKMKISRKALMLLMAICGFIQQQSFGQQADMILTDGKIFTSESSRLYVEAIAIKGNKIIAIGKNAEVEKLAGNTTKKIDLNGKTVVPGFNNAHDHLGWAISLGNFFNAEFSVPGPDKKSVIDSVARLAKSAKPGEWISGLIGLTIYYDTEMRKTLDSLSPNNPVQLQVMWGHGVVLNSLAMKVLNIAENEPDPLGGWYKRKDGSDTITGALYEYAQWPALQAIAASQPSNVVKSIQNISQQQLAMGITSVQHMNYFHPSEMSSIFKQANLSQRIRIIPFPGTANNRREIEEWKKADPHPAPMVELSGIKYLIDGTPFDESALMKTVYPDSAGWFGRTDFPVDTIRQILREAYNSSTPLLMHIVGDSTLSVVLSLMKQTGKAAIWKTRRVRFEHNLTGNATASEIQSILDMGIIMAHTPKYAQSGRVQSLLSKGISVSVSPDGTPSPFIDILIMTTMQLNPNENISREQAVIAYTKTNAFAEFAEKEKGTLMPGMLADLAVLSQDIFTIPVEQLPATRALLTMVDGKIVYQESAAIGLFTLKKESL